MADSMEPVPPQAGPKPSRRSRRKKKGRAGRKHPRNRLNYAERFAKSIGIQEWPPKLLPTPPVASEPPKPVPTAVGPETQPSPSQGPQKPVVIPPAGGGGNPQAIVDGWIEGEDDVRKLRQLMSERSWVIPHQAYATIPTDLLLMFFGKLRKKGEIQDADISPETRLMAARLLQMMNSSNNTAAAQLMPSRGQIKAEAKIKSPDGTTASLSVQIYIPHNERDVIDSTADEAE